MAVIETWLAQDLQKPVKVQYLDGNLFSNNGNGNLIGVVVTNNGEAVTLSGTVSGYAVLCDGTTVPCTGSKTNNKASILVPPAAYLPGSIFITVFLTDGTTVTTLGAVASNVLQARTDNQVDPGSVVSDWTTTINAAMQAVETAAANLGHIVATPYADLSFPVPIGKYTYYNGNVYRCTTPISTSESFTPGHWTSAISLGDEVQVLNTSTADLPTIRTNITSNTNNITALKTAFDVQKHSVLVDGELYELNSSMTFEQGNFTSTGDSSSTKWIRTPKNNKIPNNFIIYNPYRLQFAIAEFYGNSFLGYINIGTDVVTAGIYRDKYLKVKQNNYTGHEFRLRVANYLTSEDLTPAENTLHIFTKCDAENKGVYRTVNFAIGNGAVLDTGTIASGANYRYTDTIKLYAGETIHFEYAGPSNLVCLSKWSPTSDGSSPIFTYDSALITGDGLYHVAEYTAESDMFVRISTMIYPVNNKPYTNADELLSTTFIFRADTYYDKTHPLYGKTITLMGDSLSYGSLCGNGAVWLQRLALKHNMTAYNMGINGNAITSGYGTGTPMSERYTSIPESDYIVIEGGANDKGGNAPFGEFWADAQNFVMNTDKTTFKGALNTIISGLHGMYPKAKLLFLTDYNRYPSKLHEYPDAMKEVCMMRAVPCYDNFADSGIAVQENGLKEWQDEGLWLGLSANIHFTPEAYKKFLLPKYENVLEHL